MKLRHLLLGRKVITKLESILLKSRDVTLPTKVHLVKAMVSLVAMYGCESWTTKKAEHGNIQAFELWYWRRLMRVHCTARRSNQSILKEINPDYSSEGLMLKLKLRYFGHLMWRIDSLVWISQGFTCIPHPNPPSHLPLHPIPLGLPSAPGLSTCLMHPACAGDLFHPHINVWQKPLQYCKVISLQLIKINGKNNYK